MNRWMRNKLSRGAILLSAGLAFAEGAATASDLRVRDAPRSISQATFSVPAPVALNLEGLWRRYRGLKPSTGLRELRSIARPAEDQPAEEKFAARFLLAMLVRPQWAGMAQESISKRLGAEFAQGLLASSSQLSRRGAKSPSLINVLAKVKRDLDSYAATDYHYSRLEALFSQARTRPAVEVPAGMPLSPANPTTAQGSENRPAEPVAGLEKRSRRINDLYTLAERSLMGPHRDGHPLPGANDSEEYKAEVFALEAEFVAKYGKGERLSDIPWSKHKDEPSDGKLDHYHEPLFTNKWIGENREQIHLALTLRTNRGGEGQAWIVDTEIFLSVGETMIYAYHRERAYRDFDKARTAWFAERRRWDEMSWEQFAAGLRDIGPRGGAGPSILKVNPFGLLF